MVLPSLCTYTKVSYAKRTLKRFLIASMRKRDFAAWFKSNLTKSLTNLKASIQVFQFRELYRGRYSYSELARHPGIIYVPYQVSIMS
jgi:hypothetical protein